ncbi:DMT family transporter [Ponticoccus sp. SC2-23]|uniref:DMT family transporter n=1 Tax=Alexandriicola marinus TaxID=2081710 RepID=UPI000FD7BA5F|nr:DMT family transporter [Alexandriicola marinus]MBM1219003.1 DMT family transporter [Ponticoccus sp. SC6-9]MBM1223925.1 DMT family transporter [Ponticoccus sp. SC6-15]MBM1230296.1 DMT family transporter [Ponticoccus sp. SC6-38]MBM1232891.1 DMT family transporter [Ponticoccus sp. SC6-45]MBM1237159.1 DMT family transporter [Ponticoccus sp. SC6-49]MBM1241902.1 DMT family transporter [Ponticoccus sp. SC2-64]MBM1246415.1 DMT family transporter [Ponticoccus sp. SC6-42]MBM1250893.1 DMT family tr
MENLRGALMMTAAMASFAIEDTLIKLMTGRVPPGQIISVIGFGGATVLILWLLATRQPIVVPVMRSPAALLRMAFEIGGTLFFVSSLALIPITTVSAVIQATPLVVAMGGAIFLAQPVGWRRWSAILVGLAGVLMILRPGLGEFQSATLLTVVGMLGLAARDIVTRAIGLRASGVQLTLMAFVALVPSGMFLAAITGTPLVFLAFRDVLILLGCVVVGLAGYLAIVGATRAGDIAFISSFRYTRMVFAVILGGLVFGERPDLWTVLGTTIVICAGIYVLIRERRVRAAASPPPGPAL